MTYHCHIKLTKSSTSTLRTLQLRNVLGVEVDQHPNLTSKNGIMTPMNNADPLQNVGMCVSWTVLGPSLTPSIERTEIFKQHRSSISGATTNSRANNQVDK